MTTHRESTKDPLVKIKEEMLELIAKTFGRDDHHGGIAFLGDNAAKEKIYNELAALAPTLENMDKFLRTEARSYNASLGASLKPIDITGYLALCQAVQLQQLKKETVINLFCVDAAITILQEIHTVKRGRVGLKEDLSDYAQALLSGTSPEQVIEYLKRDLSNQALVEKISTMYESYLQNLQNEVVVQSTKTAEKVAAPAPEVEETKTHKRSQSASSLQMWKKYEDPRLSQIENKCDEMMNDNSKGSVWAQKHKEDVEKVKSEYQQLLSEFSKTKNKGMEYRLNNLGLLVDDVNAKLNKSLQVTNVKNKK